MNEDNWKEEFRNLKDIGDVWYFIRSEAVKPVMNEVLLTKAGREKDSMPARVNNYLKKNAKNRQIAYKE